MKVIIYRGDKQQAERELEQHPLRIGRSPDNDIVLEDPGKGVSRRHAEIRPEDDGYTLVDLESQNGIWVGGSRVPSVRLEPGVAVAVGPYRLVIPEEVSTAAAPPPAKEPAVEPTEYSRPVDARVIAAVGGLLGPSAETGPVEPIVPPAPPASVPIEPIVPLPPAPAAAPGTGSSAVRPAPRDGAASTLRAPSTAKTGGGKSRWAVFAAAAVLLLAAAAFGAYKLVLRQAPKPVWSRAAAVALVNQGRCAEAIQQQIGPALAANPSDPDAIALKAQCAPQPAPPPAPAPAPPAPDPTAQALDAVDASLGTNDCQSALDAVNAVLATAPDNVRAHDLKAKADDCVKAAARARPALPAVATATAPAKGGLDVLPGETPQAYGRRMQAKKQEYDDALALLQAQHYQQALKAFDAIAATVPAGYLDVAQRRSDARAALRDESGRQYAAGQQAEQNGDFANALQRYQRAHDLDASRDVSADVARVNDQKTRLGHEACANGDAFFLVSRNTDAAAQYLKVVQLLPETDMCYKNAKARLLQINGR
ncbi:MAG TPA: FHA domain-containing protein [Vicinamibacterales bacterium]